MLILNNLLDDNLAAEVLNNVKLSHPDIAAGKFENIAAGCLESCSGVGLAGSLPAAFSSGPLIFLI
jgi:hypothetical protein